jgi:hypothetical protein
MESIAGFALFYHQDRSPASAEGNWTTGQENVEECPDELQAGAYLEDNARVMRQRGYKDLVKSQWGRGRLR